MASSVVSSNFRYHLSASANYPYVNASIEAELIDPRGSGDDYREWKMYLQRRDTHGGWSTLGTREGYVTLNSSSHRQFSNIASGGRPLRVWVSLIGRGKTIDYYL